MTWTYFTYFATFLKRKRCEKNMPEKSGVFWCKKYPFQPDSNMQ